MSIPNLSLCLLLQPLIHSTNTESHLFSRHHSQSRKFVRHKTSILPIDREITFLRGETEHTHTNPHTFLTLINSTKKNKNKTKRRRSQEDDDYLTQRWRSQDVSDHLKKTLLHT